MNPLALVQRRPTSMEHNCRSRQCFSRSGPTQNCLLPRSEGRIIQTVYRPSTTKGK